MRKIKFRGKDNQGKWLFGGVTEDKKFISDKFTFTGVKPETVGQFTGFYDKFNNEIYEGDIVKLDETPYQVKWIERKGSFIAENYLVHVTLSKLESCEIVGNIHDTPNLFKELQEKFIGSIE